MTNKSFIVKYVFVDVDVNNNIDKNFDSNLDKRESFNDTNFNAFVAQNVCFFDIANKTRSTKLNISIDDITRR